MNLAVSNIAWSPQLEEEALAVLRLDRIGTIEVAPTRLWPDWNSASPQAGADARRNLAGRGFSVPALQAILFGKPDHCLFGSENQRLSLLRHLRMCADLAQSLGAHSLVFGAPKNRELNGINPEMAFAMAREFFTEVAAYYERREVCLCLEANPPQYGCQFLTTAAEAARMVRAVNRPGLRLHLDTACMHLAGEDLPAMVRAHCDVLRHFHVSEPFLGSFDNPVIDHARVAEALRSAGYRAWVSLEMRETEPPLTNLATAAGFLVRTYRGGEG